MRVRLILLIGLAGFLFGCEKNEGGDYSARPEFIGYWNASISSSKFVHLTIDNSSYATYDIEWEGDNHVYTGPAVENDKYIKIHGNSYYLEIIEYPHTIDTAVEKYWVHDPDYSNYRLANWKMTLYGLQPERLYACATWTFYKADY